MKYLKTDNHILVASRATYRCDNWQSFDVGDDIIYYIYKVNNQLYILELNYKSNIFRWIEPTDKQQLIDAIISIIEYNNWISEWVLPLIQKS
jgi:hypothetical protein